MTTKWLKPNNGKLSNIIKDSADQQKAIGFSVSKLYIETKKAQLESHSKSEINGKVTRRSWKNGRSSRIKQVSKKAIVKKCFTNLRH